LGKRKTSVHLSKTDGVATKKLQEAIVTEVWSGSTRNAGESNNDSDSQRRKSTVPPCLTHQEECNFEKTMDQSPSGRKSNREKSSNSKKSSEWCENE